MYCSSKRTITYHLFLWAVLFAIFFLVPDLQAQDAAKAPHPAPDMGSWISSIATFAVSLGVLFLLLVFSVLVIMFWGVVGSIKSIINVFAEKEQENMSMLHEKAKCRLSNKKSKAKTTEEILDILKQIKTNLDPASTQIINISDIQGSLGQIKTVLDSILASTDTQTTNSSAIQQSLAQIEAVLNSINGKLTEYTTDVQSSIFIRTNNMLASIESILNTITQQLQRLSDEGDTSTTPED